MNEYNLTDMLLRIKNMKRQKKITNEMLSKKTNIPLGTLSKILAGVTKEPSVESIIRIARALETTADYLILGNLPQTAKTPTFIREYNELNDLGKQKTIEYINDLAENPKYTQQPKKANAVSDFDLAVDITGIAISATNKNKTNV